MFFFECYMMKLLVGLKTPKSMLTNQEKQYPRRMEQLQRIIHGKDAIKDEISSYEEMNF